MLQTTDAPLGGYVALPFPVIPGVLVEGDDHKVAGPGRQLIMSRRIGDIQEIPST